MKCQQLAELYILLQTYIQVYDTQEQAESLLNDIEQAYEEQAKIEKAPDIKNIIKNPRGSGRKSTMTTDQKNKIFALHQEGKTIREIASEIPCSIGYVHKLINERK